MKKQDKPIDLDKRRKEKLTKIEQENYCVFGVRVVFKDGIIYKDNFYDNQLGHLIGRWRGSKYKIDNKNKVYPLTNLGDGNFETIKNSEREKVLINVDDISFIKYKQNTSAYGPKRKENEIIEFGLFE